jgi:hypothetical protein
MTHYILATVQIPIEVTEAGLFVVLEKDVRMTYDSLPSTDTSRSNANISRDLLLQKYNIKDIFDFTNIFAMAEISNKEKKKQEQILKKQNEAIEKEEKLKLKELENEEKEQIKRDKNLIQQKENEENKRINKNNTFTKSFREKFKRPKKASVYPQTYTLGQTYGLGRINRFQDTLKSRRI